jgi:hypothetical protein
MNYSAASGRGIKEPPQKAKYALRGWGIEPKRELKNPPPNELMTDLTG